MNSSVKYVIVISTHLNIKYRQMITSFPPPPIVHVTSFTPNIQIAYSCLFFTPEYCQGGLRKYAMNTGRCKLFLNFAFTLNGHPFICRKWLKHYSTFTQMYRLYYIKSNRLFPTLRKIAMHLGTVKHEPIRSSPPLPPRKLFAGAHG